MVEFSKWKNEQNSCYLMFLLIYGDSIKTCNTLTESKNFLLALQNLLPEDLKMLSKLILKLQHSS